MDDKRFQNLMEWVNQRITEMRTAGKDNDFLRCWLIGIVTYSDIDIQEEVFTSSQLKKLFKITFE